MQEMKAGRSQWGFVSPDTQAETEAGGLSSAAVAETHWAEGELGVWGQQKPSLGPWCRRE